MKATDSMVEKLFERMTVMTIAKKSNCQFNYFII